MEFTEVTDPGEIASVKDAKRGHGPALSTLTLALMDGKMVKVQKGQSISNTTLVRHGYRLRTRQHGEFMYAWAEKKEEA